MLNDIDTEKGVYADPAPPNNHHIQNGPGHETPLTEVVEDLAGSVQDEKSVDTWKYPRINLWRYLATLFCMLMLGANDASIGALLPYIQEYYSIGYTVVATMFLSQVAGYTASALLINKMHMRFGQVGIAVISSSCKIVAYIVTCVHPPFPTIPVIYAVAGFGNGLQDGAWNAWVGGLAHPNELLGLLHGAYGLGATIAPLISTAMVTTGGLQWYTFYYIMIGAAAFELIVTTWAFRRATGAKFREANPKQGKGESRTREIFTYKVTWILALFLLCYVGAEVSVGGWVVTFMLEERSGEAFASGMVATGFWLGLTVGRVILGFVTARMGEKLAITVYLVLAVAMELLFWQIRSFVSSAIFVAFLGFFLGPIFPGAIVVITKRLPTRLHVSAIGFIAAVGASGAAVIPFATGAIAQSKGVQVLEPIALGLIAGILLMWLTLPGGFKKGLEKTEEKVEERTEDVQQV